MHGISVQYILKLPGMEGNYFFWQNIQNNNTIASFEPI